MSLEYPGDSQYPILRSFRMIYNDNRTSLSPKEGINKKRKKTQENACMEEKENRWFVGPSSRSGFPRNTWSTTLSENCIGKLPTCQPDQLLGSDKANTTTSVIRRDDLFVTCFRICITACDTQPELLLPAILLFRYHSHLQIHHPVYNVQPTKSFPPSIFYADSRVLYWPAAVETLTTSHSRIQIVRNKALLGNRVPSCGCPTCPP